MQIYSFLESTSYRCMVQKNTVSLIDIFCLLLIDFYLLCPYRTNTEGTYEERQDKQWGHIINRRMIGIFTKEMDNITHFGHLLVFFSKTILYYIIYFLTLSSVITGRRVRCLTIRPALQTSLLHTSFKLNCSFPK